MALHAPIGNRTYLRLFGSGHGSAIARPALGLLMLDSPRFGLGLSFGFTGISAVPRRCPALPGWTLAYASSRLGVTAQRHSSRYASPMVRLDGHVPWPPDRGMAPPMRCHSPLRIAMEYLGVWRCYGTGWGSIEARPGTLRYNASRDYGRACALRRPAAFLAFPSVFSCQGAEW